MKRAMNFRLDQQTITTISILEDELSASKTAIVEKAIAHYAKHKLTKQAAYMQHAGCLNEEESQQMIKAIKRGHKNKKMKKL